MVDETSPSCSAFTYSVGDTWNISQNTVSPPTAQGWHIMCLKLLPIKDLLTSRDEANRRTPSSQEKHLAYNLYTVAHIFSKLTYALHCFFWQAKKTRKFVVLHMKSLFFSFYRAKFLGFEFTISPWIPRSPMCRPHPCPTLRPAGLHPTLKNNSSAEMLTLKRKVIANNPSYFKCYLRFSGKKCIYQLSQMGKLRKFNLPLQCLS